MVFYTGKQVKVWITHENNYADADTFQLAVVQSDAAGLTEMSVMTTGTTRSPEMFAGPIYSAGHADLGVTDLTGVDISIGSVDEDISYFQTANVGKIEVKKETSVTLTKKMSDKAFLVAYQGQVLAGSAEDSVGEHPTRWGLKESTTPGARISSGATDPKNTTNSVGGAITYGYRVYIQLKTSGQILALPNCTLMSHAVTIGNDAATEETVEFMTTVKPLMSNDGSFNKTATLAANI